jgi:membrane protein CcdC involved in cytochrome C biogenesis
MKDYFVYPYFELIEYLQLLSLGILYLGCMNIKYVNLELLNDNVYNRNIKQDLLILETLKIQRILCRNFSKYYL